MKNNILHLFGESSAGAVFLPLHALAPLVFAFIVQMPSARAAGAMVIDDARIVDVKTCQLETWMKKGSVSTEYWALPACNSTGNLELTFGGARINASKDDHAADVVLQGKTLFRTLTTNDWGIGLAFGSTRHSATGNNDPYAYVPASVSFNDNRLVLHANLGWVHEHETHQDRLTWGLGAETTLTARVSLVAEVYDQNHDEPFYQIGLLHGIVSNGAQISATYGNHVRHNGDEHWYSVNISLSP